MSKIFTKQYDVENIINNNDYEGHRLERLFREVSINLDKVIKIENYREDEFCPGPLGGGDTMSKWVIILYYSCGANKETTTEKLIYYDGSVYRKELDEIMKLWKS